MKSGVGVGRAVAAWPRMRRRRGQPRQVRCWHAVAPLPHLGVWLRVLKGAVFARPWCPWHLGCPWHLLSPMATRGAVVKVVAIGLASSSALGSRLVVAACCHPVAARIRARVPRWRRWRACRRQTRVRNCTRRGEAARQIGRILRNRTRVYAFISANSQLPKMRFPAGARRLATGLGTDTGPVGGRRCSHSWAIHSCPGGSLLHGCSASAQRFGASG